MQLSVVIPTYNRSKDLKEALDSLCRQTIPPKEIIIVDDSDNNEIERLLSIWDDQHLERINLNYIRKKERGLALSINIGIKNSSSDIILILDQDVILEKSYIEEILNVYKNNPNALGVQGYVTNYKTSKLKNIINRFFFLVHSRPNINRLLPSMQNVYAMPLNKIINCQWMVGNNMNFKKEVFNFFQFDENLKKISWGHDQDLTCRIYKKFPYALYQTPFAKLYHKAQTSYGKQSEKAIHRGQIHQMYLFYKNMDETFKNRLIFLWSKIGLLLLSFGAIILRLSEARALRPLCLIHSYAFCLRHLNKIRTGDLEFFNKMLK